MSPTEIPALRTKCCKRLSLAHLQTLRSWIHLHSYLHTQNPKPTSLHTNNYADTSSQFFTGRMLFLTPNQQCESTEGSSGHYTVIITAFIHSVSMTSVHSIYCAYGNTVNFSRTSQIDFSLKIRPFKPLGQLGQTTPKSTPCPY